MNNPQTKQIPFPTSGINKAINVLSDILSPKQPAMDKTAAPPRVASNRILQPPPRVKNTTQVLPRVHNDHDNGRKLLLRLQPIPQKYSRGTTVYKQFQNKYHWGYICDYNSKEGY